MPKMSIIIPMHNSAEYIAECLASVEMQTLKDIEVVCIDDASTDATLSVFELFANGDKRFRFKHFDENQGVSAARNEGIAMATGEYLAFLDDDDWYPEKTTLEKLYLAASEHDAPIAGGSFSEYDNRTNRVTDDYTGFDHLSCFTFTQEGRVEYSDWQGDFGFQRFIFKREFILEQGIEFPPLIRHEDPLFLVRAMVAAGWFFAIPDVVYRYRYHHKSRMLTLESIDDAFEAIAEILAISFEQDLPVLRKWQIEIMRVYAADSFGLVFNEKELLQKRAVVLRRIGSSKAFQQIAGILGSYRNYADDFVKQLNLE